jgi:catechol 2,3-dioxygenase-like lactoylglutathione lyase family enzyme
MSVVGLDHVQLAAPAGGEPAARRFYGELLGLSEVPKPEGVRSSGGVWFAIGSSGQELHIGIQDPFAPATKAHPGLLVGSSAELRALADRLSAADVPVRFDERIAGVERFFAADPWGNRLELRSTRAVRS